FGQEFLDRKDLEIDFNKARLYFKCDYSPNAAAGIKNDFYVVEINVGLVSWLYDYFNSKEDLLKNPTFDKFRAIANKKGVTPERFLIQLISLFCLYHEVGHLIQRYLEKEGDDYVEFSDADLNLQQVKVRHIRELDADW